MRQMMRQISIHLKNTAITGHEIIKSYGSGMIISLIVGLGFILIAGPNLQTFVVSILTSESSSIYSAAYSTAIVQFPPLRHWLFSVSNIPYWVISLLIIATSFTRIVAREMFVRAAVASFLLLTTFDALYIFSEDQNWGSLAPSILANLAGGPLVAGILILLLYSNLRLADFLSDHHFLRRACIWTWPALTGLVVQIIAYYLTLLFYNPTTSSMQLAMSPPISGYYVTKDQAKDDADVENFGPLTGPIDMTGVVTWVGAGKSFKANWMNEGSRFDLTVSFYDGCNVGKHDLPKSQDRLIFEDFQEISASWDDGPTEIAMGSSKNTDSRITPEGENYGMFWITPGSENDTMGVSRFTSEDIKVDYSNPSGDLNVNASAILLSNNPPNETTQLSNRTFILTVDGKKQIFEFAPNPESEMDASVDCKQISAKPFGETTTSMLVGVYLLLEPQDVSIAASIARREGNAFSITGINGWLSADNVPPEQASTYFRRGNADHIAIRGVASRLRVNGISFDGEDSIELHIGNADVVADVDSTGRLLVTGEAQAIARNGERITLTRWERLEWPARALLLGGVPTIIFWLLRILQNLLQRNADMRLTRGVARG